MLQRLAGRWKAFSVRVRNAIVSRAYRYAPAGVRRWGDEYSDTKRTSRSPDRPILLYDIFPQLVKLLEHEDDPKLLWVGCARLTKTYYPILESKGARCWTIDINPDVRRWGRRGRHVVGDIQQLAAMFPPNYFDIILFNGVFGYGINDAATQVVACSAMAHCIKPNGYMLLA